MSQVKVAHRALVVVLLALMAPFFVASAVAQQAESLEVVMGDENAPVTVIEYMSLTCPHCANFHIETLPDVDTPDDLRRVLRDPRLAAPLREALHDVIALGGRR